MVRQREQLRVARDTVTVILTSDNSQRVYPIDGYDYDDEVITVIWRRGDEALTTEFAEFTADHESMVQQENDMGRSANFQRCS